MTEPISRPPCAEQSEDDLRGRFAQVIGVSDPGWEACLRLDPEFMARFLDLAETPVRHAALDPRSRALISLGVTAAVTTLDHAGIATAVRQAAAAGATRDEVLEAVELVSVLGVHTLATGFPILALTLEDKGRALVPPGELTAEQTEIRSTFTANRGYWSDLNEIQLRVDPGWFSAYTAFSSHPWLTGTLTPKLRELIYIAIDLSPTHLFIDGVGPHIENAIEYGATPEELVETLEVTALAGIASLRAAAPIVDEVFSGADHRPGPEGAAARTAGSPAPAR